MKPNLAHVKQDEHGKWIEHSLEEHLYEVGTLAAEFANAFASQDWARAAGLWHDLGKYRKAFQGYIRKASGYDPEAHIEQGKGRVDHSTAGALYACQKLKGAGRFLAYLIAGHHAGLPDWDKAEAGDAALENRLSKGRNAGYLEQALQADIPADILDPSVNLASKPPGGVEGLHLWLRMLFSCLVDADFLDTERFMDTERAKARQFSWSMKELKDRFDTYMDHKAKSAEPTQINAIRAGILQDCRQSAQESPGIFTLTVPTGGGKTLSGMAFALEHAAEYAKKRIIVAIPYTSIIEQNAEQYREIFGDAVLEHHSNLDPDKVEKENTRSRLAAENWDAPIVVTTNVQLLESLFSARTSRCRKLHNLVDAVIMIDEAQLLPPDFLQPVLDVLRLLTEHYGVTLVLSTATQPALGSVQDSFGKTQLHGLDAKREIISDVDGLFTAMQRVEVVKPDDLNARRDWVSLAKELEQHSSVLVIVNTRRDARELYELMQPGTVHLSALMCAEHRSRVISDIKKRLKAGEPVRVISTQLVEAGVDLDFPVVYRALAGLDSIAQAAGRCNREGKLDKGRVVVFVPPKSPPKGLLLYGEQATRSVWHGQKTDLLSHRLFDSYFRQYFAQEDSDKYQILPLLTQEARRGAVQFRSAAEHFCLIPDSGVSVLVPYGEDGEDGFKLLDQLRHLGPERWLMRKLQRLSVNLYQNEFEALRALGAVEELHPGIWGVCVTNAYDKKLGLLPADSLRVARRLCHLNQGGNMPVNFCLEVSGDYACFTRPEMKVERVSYDVITPSAARAIFEAVFWKPAIRWQITRIEVLNPINWISVRRNEVGKVFTAPTAAQLVGESRQPMGFYVEEERLQRAGLFLRDVKYRLFADLHFHQNKDPEADYGKYAAMFERRVAKGQCFNQPYLGTREFSCAFRLVDDSQTGNEPPPISEDRVLGWMLYDLDYSDRSNPMPRFFNAVMQQGVIKVPAWHSEEVRG